MPLPLHVLLRVTRPLCSLGVGGGGEGAVTLGMFPGGCGDTVVRRWLIFRRGGGAIYTGSTNRQTHCALIPPPLPTHTNVMSKGGRRVGDEAQCSGVQRDSGAHVSTDAKRETVRRCRIAAAHLTEILRGSRGARQLYYTGVVLLSFWTQASFAKGGGFLPRADL